MKTFEELTKLEKSVLLTWGEELDNSTATHYTLQRIRRKLTHTHPGIRVKDLRRIITTLINSGFFIKHPTGGSTTYHLSLDGLRCCNIIRDENDI